MQQEVQSAFHPLGFNVGWNHGQATGQSGACTRGVRCPDTVRVRPYAMALTRIVAENLLAARKQGSISQRAVAKKARVSVSYISMLERGERTPPLETLEVLAKALGVRPLDLFQELSTERARPRRR